MTEAGARHYQRMNIEAMSPERRVVFLYAFVRAHLVQAQHAIARGAVEARNEALNRAQDGIQELLLALDRDQGGDLAANLAALYAYFLREMFEIDRAPDAERLNRLIDQVHALHDAWEQVARPVPAAVPRA